MSFKSIEKKREYNRIWMLSYYKRNKEKVLASSKKYRLAHPEKFKEYQKKYESKYPQRVCESKLKWYHNNPEQYKEWAKNNLDKVRVAKRKYKLNHPDARLASNLRTRIVMALKGRNLLKQKKTADLIGCSVPELKIHLEKQFKEGMNWENRGLNGWHIDHIKPIILFDLSSVENQKQAFHYTNLQPLWAKDNLIKKDKYDK